MKQNILYLIIYISLCAGVCSCERLEIPAYEEESPEKDEENPLLPDMGEDEVRDGSREAPYTVAHAQAIGEEYFEVGDAWIEGYIVGWISGSHYPNGARFSAQSAGNTNLLLADSIYENDPAHCIPVQLPTNSQLRQELNLADNPTNLRRHVKLKGDITGYFNTTGVKNTSVYEWLGSSAMEDEKIALSVTELYEDFSGFKVGDSLSLKNWSAPTFWLDYWKIGGNRVERYATICHTDTFSNRTFEYWLITPPLNLKRMKNAHFSFSTAYENWDGRSKLDVFIIGEKDPFSLGILPFLNAQIADPTHCEAHEWYPSGDISLESYSGVQYIGFRYKGKSTGKDGTTFCIDNIRLVDKELEVSAKHQ